MVLLCEGKRVKAMVGIGRQVFCTLPLLEQFFLAQVRLIEVNRIVMKFR